MAKRKVSRETANRRSGANGVKPFFSYKGNYGSQSKLVEKDDVLQDDDLIVKELNKFFQNDVSTVNIEKPGSSSIGHQTIFLIL